MHTIYLYNFLNINIFNVYVCCYTYTCTYLLEHNWWIDGIYNIHLNESLWQYSDFGYKLEMPLNSTNFFLGNTVMWYVIWQVVNTWKNRESQHLLLNHDLRHGRTNWAKGQQSRTEHKMFPAVNTDLPWMSHSASWVAWKCHYALSSSLTEKTSSPIS